MFDIVSQFKSWCFLKIGIHTKQESLPLFKAGQIWWCSLGMNVGSEIFGKGNEYRRPVLILKKFSSNTFLCLPLTLQEKMGSWFVEIELQNVKRWVILSQAKTCDARRLQYLIGQVRDSEFEKVRREFVRLISC